MQMSILRSSGSQVTFLSPAPIPKSEIKGSKVIFPSLTHPTRHLSLAPSVGLWSSRPAHPRPGGHLHLSSPRCVTILKSSSRKLHTCRLGAVAREPGLAHARVTGMRPRRQAPGKPVSTPDQVPRGRGTCSSLPAAGSQGHLHLPHKPTASPLRRLLCYPRHKTLLSKGPRDEVCPPRERGRRVP